MNNVIADLDLEKDQSQDIPERDNLEDANKVKEFNVEEETDIPESGMPEDIPEKNTDEGNVLTVHQGTDVAVSVGVEAVVVDKGTDVAVSAGVEAAAVYSEPGTAPSENVVSLVGGEGVLGSTTMVGHELVTGSLETSTSPPRTPRKAKGLNEFYSASLNDNQARVCKKVRVFPRELILCQSFN